MSEKLTDAQREAITNCTDEAAWHAGCEALYLIDAQAAELEGDNGLRALNAAGWAIAKARAEALNIALARISRVQDWIEAHEEVLPVTCLELRAALVGGP